MKHINKDIANEPKSLKLHRQKSFSDYDNYSEKDDLRAALLQEQGFICCYCMSKIQAPTQYKMKIEHFKSQAQHPKLQLNYNNILGSCRGNEFSDFKNFHCDFSKADKNTQLDPTNPHITKQIKFDKSGGIYIENLALQNELDEILNLNLEHLRIQREAVYKGVIHFLKREFGKKPVKKSLIQKKVAEWKSKKNGKYRPFCQVAIYFLEKYLAKAS